MKFANPASNVDEPFALDPGEELYVEFTTRRRVGAATLETRRISVPLEDAAQLLASIAKPKPKVKAA